MIIVICILYVIVYIILAMIGPLTVGNTQIETLILNLRIYSTAFKGPTKTLTT